MSPSTDEPRDLDLRSGDTSSTREAASFQTGSIHELMNATDWRAP